MKLSIIIPAYNAEKYLVRCLDSVAAQTFADFECIVVNDGSTDKTADVAAKYVSADARFRLITKENAGQGFARNTGLDAMNGEYVSFLDADDSIEPEMYGTLINALEKYSADISECGYYTVSTDGKRTSCLMNLPEGLLGGDLQAEYCLRGLKNPANDYPVCTKVYRSSLFDGLRFPKLSICEDYLINFVLFGRAKSVCYTDRCFYNYSMSENSTVRSPLSDKDDAFIINCGEVVLLAEKTGNPTLVKLAKDKLASVYFTLTVKAYRYGIKAGYDKSKLKSYTSKLCENAVILLKSDLCAKKKLAVIYLAARIKTGLLEFKEIN